MGNTCIHKKMPKEISDIKRFLQLTKLDEVKEKAAGGESKKPASVSQHKKVLYIKKTKKITKFKLRGRRYLYTFKCQDQTKAQKVLQSLPSNLTRVELGKQQKKAATKKKK
eukprot:TRINITY_DN3447_c0_g1_i2.p1 TRINITY_DN3447_c0_g1~~TRINITY_DN3447_c0_g1_i2.p1  ORF type:complete len:111 (+),score=46.97 TRINITY_DN3447_c0_g1_i2:100-432(+)